MACPEHDEACRSGGSPDRGSDLIIPDGDFVLRADDRVLMISMLTEVPALERMMRTGGKIDFLR